MDIFSLLISTAHAGVISDAPKVSEVLLNFFKFLLSIFGVVAICGLVAVGIRYLFAGRNEESMRKTKRWLLYAVVGIIIAIGSLIIVTWVDNILLGDVEA